MKEFFYTMGLLLLCFTAAVILTNCKSTDGWTEKEVEWVLEHVS